MDPDINLISHGFEIKSARNHKVMSNDCEAEKISLQKAIN